MLYETTSLACTTIRLPFSCCPAPLGPLNIRPFSAHDHPTFSAAAHFSLACQFRLTQLPSDLLTLCDILIFAASGVRRPRMSSLVISLSANSVLLDLLQEFEVSLGWIFWSSLSFSNGPAPPLPKIYTLAPPLPGCRFVLSDISSTGICFLRLRVQAIYLVQRAALECCT